MKNIGALVQLQINFEITNIIGWEHTVHWAHNY